MEWIIPVIKSHGADALANFKKYDDLRYRLIPYIYSNAYTQYQTGMPLMRGLMLENQTDANTYNVGDEYLFGNNFLVAPVTVKGAQTRTIYVPEGNWFNYWTGEKYSGKQYIHILTPMDELPLFVKGGAIIPMQSARKYMDEKPVDEIMLDIFPHKLSQFKLYEDDGTSLKYQQGDVATTMITSINDDTGLMLNISTPVGKFIPSSHTYLAKIHWNNSKAPLSVTENKEALKQAGNTDNLQTASGWYYDKTAKLLWIKAVHSNRAVINLVVK